MIQRLQLEANGKNKSCELVNLNGSVALVKIGPACSASLRVIQLFCCAWNYVIYSTFYGRAFSCDIRMESAIIEFAFFIYCTFPDI